MIVQKYNYYWAYKYVCKSDKDVLLSAGHENLIVIGSPKTNKCVRTYCDKMRKRRSEDTHGNESQASTSKAAKGKVHRLSNPDVAKFMVENNIKKVNELLAAGKERQVAGNDDLASFCLSRDLKKLEQVIENTWRMETAGEDIAREKTPRIEILRAASEGECVNGCNGQWYDCAFEVLTNNRIHPVIFAAAIRELIEKGQGKFRNLMIIGPANCGKTFLLAPLHGRNQFS